MGCLAGYMYPIVKVVRLLFSCCVSVTPPHVPKINPLSFKTLSFRFAVGDEAKRGLLRGQMRSMLEIAHCPLAPFLPLIPDCMV
jgi:hypothetical protein